MVSRGITAVQLESVWGGRGWLVNPHTHLILQSCSHKEKQVLSMLRRKPLITDRFLTISEERGEIYFQQVHVLKIYYGKLHLGIKATIFFEIYFGQ